MPTLTPGTRLGRYEICAKEMLTTTAIPWRDETMGRVAR